LPGLDFVSLAKGLGCDARRIDRPEALGDSLARAFERTDPFLLDVCVDQAIPILYERPSR